MVLFYSYGPILFCSIYVVFVFGSFFFLNLWWEEKWEIVKNTMIKNNSNQEGAIQKHEVEIQYLVERRSKGNSTEQERGKFKEKSTTAS